eukprot:763392-Hanusia_phi.AAC.5
MSGSIQFNAHQGIDSIRCQYSDFGPGPGDSDCRGQTVGRAGPSVPPVPTIMAGALSDSPAPDLLVNNKAKKCVWACVWACESRSPGP